MGKPVKTDFDRSLPTRRELLGRLATAAIATSGAATTATSSVETSPSHVVTRGNWVEGGSDNTIGVDVVDMTSDSYERAGIEVLEGIDEGLRKLSYQITGFGGFRLKLWSSETTFDGDNTWDDLDEALTEEEFTGSGHYHVLYDGSFGTGSYHGTAGSETAWGHDVRAISGLSMWRTAYSSAPAYVRGLHQVLHTYIDDEIAIAAADYDGSAYDAIHRLGTVKSHDDRMRSVMADIYPGPGAEGSCAGGVMHGSYPPYRGRLYFSECTKRALLDSLNSRVYSFE